MKSTGWAVPSKRPRGNSHEQHSSRRPVLLTPRNLRFRGDPECDLARMSNRAGTAADDQFYREYILDHYKNPRNFGRLENPDINHEEEHPLGGDVICMDFRVKDGVIEDVRFHGRGCAISQASASLLTERLKGLSLEEAKKIGKDDVLGELGIDISPARIKCALLSLKVLKVGAYGLAGSDEDEE